jgi:hypothetical protein
MGSYLEGCPWNAIDMIDIKSFEGQWGDLPF